MESRRVLKVGVQPYGRFAKKGIKFHAKIKKNTLISIVNIDRYIVCKYIFHECM